LKANTEGTYFRHSNMNLTCEMQYKSHSYF